MTLATQLLIVDEDIRDTSSHAGSTADNVGFAIKTLIVENSLNQIVTLQCKASAHADFSNSFNVGSSWDASASTNSYQTCDSYFPYFRIDVVCSTAPTSGTIKVYLERISG